MRVQTLLIFLLFLSLAAKAQRKKIVGPLSDGMAWVKQKGKYGFQNKEGELLIPFKFDSVFSFTEGLAAVKVDTNWFYINKGGSAAHFRSNWINDSTQVNEVQYWEIARPFYHGIAVVKWFREPEDARKYDLGYFAIDTTGYPALGDFGADSLGDFNKKYAEIVYEDRHGIIDMRDDILVPAIYEDVDSFSNGWVKVKLNGQWMILNPYGECVQNCNKKKQSLRKYNSSYHTLYFPNVFNEDLFDEINRFKLAALISFMERHPNRRIVIYGNGSTRSYATMQRSWDYVNATINYVINHSNVQREQFIFNYGGTGKDRTVSIRLADCEEDGPHNLPPPFPYFSVDLKKE